MAHYVVVGGGIVGLATAHRLALEYPHSTVTVLDKEDRVAAHQTGHNSGVIHAGVYDKPGSLKASLCRSGAASMVRFCQANGIPYRICGQLIVAADESELPRLAALQERAELNGLPVRRLGPAQAREIEPNVACVAALHIAPTGIVDYTAVAARLAELVDEAGGTVRLGARVTQVRPYGRAVVVETTIGSFRADYLINCAGLHADRVARLAGLHPPARIVPFRGEYYELTPQARPLVKGLIYPVPDPRFPFPGVHLTRLIDGTVHAGPNAVLATAREGYSWGRFRVRDVVDEATYPGLWRLARRNLPYGWSEVCRSLSRRRFAASLARLVPAVSERDIVRAGAGVRAQAIARDGSLVDDLLILRARRQVHVINAPSPAATSSLEIARHLVTELHS